MINFSKYKIILWDFDGVLMDSMPVRDSGFLKVLSDYPTDQVSALMTYHRANGGLSRYVKFKYFFEEIRGESVSEEKILSLADSFSKIMMEQLINPDLLIEDSINFVKENCRKVRMHIVSGSDGQELNEICRQLNLSNFFYSIHGSPTPKTELVAGLLRQNNDAKTSTVLIGDSKNDWEAASVNGIDFLGYNNTKIMSLGLNYIHSFSYVG